MWYAVVGFLPPLVTGKQGEGSFLSLPGFPGVFLIALCTSLKYYDPWEHLEQAWQTNKAWETCGLDITTADKFAKQNGVKNNNNDGKTEINTNENITNKDKTQQRTKLRPLGGNPCKQGHSRVQLHKGY